MKPFLAHPEPRLMDAEKYRIFMAIAAVATTLTFVIRFSPDAGGAAGAFTGAVAGVWGAATQHPWLAVGLTLPLAAGLTWVLVRLIDER